MFKYTQQFINLLSQNGINESDPDFNQKAEEFVNNRTAAQVAHQENIVSKKQYQQFPSEWELRGSKNGQ